MLKELIKFANHLDKKGLRKEADILDKVIKRYAQEEPETLGLQIMTSLCNYLGSLYKTNCSFEFSSKDESGTNYQVEDCDLRVVSEIVRRESVEHKGKNFSFEEKEYGALATCKTSDGTFKVLIRTPDKLGKSIFTVSRA